MRSQITLAIVVALLAVVYLNRPAAVAQQAAPVQKWEYGILTQNTNYDWTWSETHNVIRAKGYEDFISQYAGQKYSSGNESGQQQYLNPLGLKGWELFLERPADSGGRQMIFKRLLP